MAQTLRLWRIEKLSWLYLFIKDCLRDIEQEEYKMYWIILQANLDE